MTFNLLLYIYRGQLPHNEMIVKLKSPKPPLVLGAPPRLAYPLVVFLIRDEENESLTHPDETVSINILSSHINYTKFLFHFFLKTKSIKEMNNIYQNNHESHA